MPRKQQQETRPRVRVRMYRHGLGDCFLVTFHTGETPVHALIDCGTLGTSGTVTLDEVAQDIARETGGRLDLLVVTHEHRDHVSGFTPERFDRIAVGHVWAAWTEDGKDPLAREVAKYKDDVLSSVAAAAHALAGDHAAAPDDRPALAEMRAGVRELLGFYGEVPPEGEPIGMAFAAGVHEAMSYATRKAGDAVRFLSPGTVVEEAWLPKVRVYVLGPPRDRQKLNNMGGHGSPELYGATSGLAAQLGASIAFGDSKKRYRDYLKKVGPEKGDEFQQQLPFEPRFRVESANQRSCGKRFASYYDPEAAWRRIDLDWLNGSSELALQLDSLTNNTSLALAFELDDGKVLLFAADAQVGNWLSWHEYTFRVGEKGKEKELKAADLLARAAFYKVGHHASHNATVNEKGLELMMRDDLMAAIPVDRQVALKKHPKWMMPADALYARLVEKTHGRVLRSDTGWPDPRPEAIPEAEWKKTQESAPIVIDRLYIDFNIS